MNKVQTSIMSFMRYLIWACKIAQIFTKCNTKRYVYPSYGGLQGKTENPLLSLPVPFFFYIVSKGFAVKIGHLIFLSLYLSRSGINHNTLQIIKDEKEDYSCTQ